MKQFLEIPYNIPSYDKIGIGNLIISYNHEYSNNRLALCHCHLLQVIDKESRYGKFYVKTLSCYCEIENYECKISKEFEINYSDMKKYSYAYRMATKAAQVLFGENK